MPTWHNLVKIGAFKELAPYDPDGSTFVQVLTPDFSTRSLLDLDLYLSLYSIFTSDVSIGKPTSLKLHGGRNRHGNCPSYHADASASVERKIRQSLENFSESITVVAELAKTVNATWTKS